MKGIIALVVTLLIAGGAVFFINMQNKSGTTETMQPAAESNQTAEETNQPAATDTNVSPAAAQTGDAMQAGAKTFTVDGESFSFSVKEMKVKQGDKVRVVFNNKEGIHDWVNDEFDARTKQIGAGQSEIVEFIASKKGTFEYYCSVGQHRANGMVGKLIVE